MSDENTDLITIPTKGDIASLFSTPDGIKSAVDRIEKEALSIHQDYSTDKGRKAARSLAAKVSRSKTLIDEVGKDLTEDWRQKTKAVNDLRNLAKTRLDEIRDKIRKPAEEAEALEAKRVQGHMVALDKFSPDALTAHHGTAEIRAKIEMIEAIEIGPSWEEFEGEAREAKAKALDKYRDDLQIAKAREDQEAELAQLRAEKEAREAAEQKRLAAEAAQKAEAERKAAEERAAREAAHKATVEAEERHKRELEEARRREDEAAQRERERAAEERRQKEAAEARRKADAEHRRRIRSEIIETITLLKPANWEEVVDAMIAGEIPHVKVLF